MQGYNAQAVVTGAQIVLAAEITTSSVDWSQLEPMVAAAIDELERAGVHGRPEAALADTQYWSEEHIDKVVAEHHVQVLIPPESGAPEEPKRWTGGRYDHMRAVLAAEHGKRLYRTRAQTIEPVFGQTKHNRQLFRFHRRGRHAVRTEWRLLMATHNLGKLYRHRLRHLRAMKRPQAPSNGRSGEPRRQTTRHATTIDARRPQARRARTPPKLRATASRGRHRAGRPRPAIGSPPSRSPRRVGDCGTPRERSCARRTESGR